MTGVQSCQPDNEPLRFTIKWWRGVYSVSIASYDGGEVVDAAAYDTLQARVDELTKALTEIDTLATCTGVVDPALHRNMLDNIYRIARRGLATSLERSGGAT